MADKYVEIVLGYPHRFPFNEKEDYFYWPAKLMMEKGYDAEFLTIKGGKDEIYNGIKIKRFNNTLSLLHHLSSEKDVKLVHSHLRPFPPSFFSSILFTKRKILTP